MHRVALSIATPRFGGYGRPVVSPPHDTCSPAAGDEPAAPNPARRVGGPRRRGPVAHMPGNYTVRLAVDGQTYTQPPIVAPGLRGMRSTMPTTAPCRTIN